MATARDHTRAAVREADIAYVHLGYFNGRIINGHGEFSDPSNAGHALRDAKRAIERALAALDAADKIGWNDSDD